MPTNDTPITADDGWVDVGTDDAASTLVDDQWDVWVKDPIGAWHYIKF